MPAKKGKDIWSRVLWFERKDRFDFDFFNMLEPCRAVTSHPRYRSGVYRSEKCGRDIQYESALELRFIERMERAPRVVFYWEQPVRIPFWRGRRKVFYTPDFGIFLDSGHFVLAEVKELPDTLDYRVERKTEALMNFCSGHGFGLLLTDGRHGPDALLKGKVNRRLEKELLEALASGELRHEQCHQIMRRCNATAAQLYMAVIRHNLKFRPFPMKIQRGNDQSVSRQVFFGRKKYEELSVRFTWLSPE